MGPIKADRPQSRYTHINNRNLITYGKTLTLKVQTLRLPEEDMKDLESLTKELKEDKASITRRALRIGIDELRLRDAVEKYKRGAISFGALSEATGLGYRELHAELKRRGVFLRYPVEDPTEE
jgi:predicted HTH domain antitoxin